MQNCRYIKTDSSKGSWCRLPPAEYSFQFPSDQRTQTRPGMSGHCCWLSWWRILRPIQLRNNTKISINFLDWWWHSTFKVHTLPSDESNFCVIFTLYHLLRTTHLEFAQLFPFESIWVPTWSCLVSIFSKIAGILSPTSQQWPGLLVNEIMLL